MDVRHSIPHNHGDWQEKFGEAWSAQVEKLKEHFGADLEVQMPLLFPTEVPILFIPKEKVLELLKFLKETPQFEYQFLSDITATDEELEPRFRVVYQLFSLTHKWRIRVKVRVRDGEEVPSATVLWKAANWAEREVYDMFGVKFSNHPNLRRILMDDRWEGHPLRKDYPLRGYQVFTDTLPIEPSYLE